MNEHDEELVRVLAPQNAEIRRSYDKHAQLKAEVDALSSRAHLTAEEEEHRRLLQRKKLALKDKIVRMLDEHRRENASASAGS